MRYITPVYFQRIKAGAYDADSGNYGEDTITEHMRLASVTDSGTSTMQLVYGGLKQGSKTIRIQNHFEEPFDQIRIGDFDDAKYYQVDTERKLTTKHNFVVSEVQ